MTRTRKFIAAALVTLLQLGLLIWTGAYAQAEPSCQGQGRNSPVTGLVKQAHPVVLVHGWDGAPMSKTRTALENRLPRGWQFLLFDYSAVHDHWAARPEVAACLAQYIGDVSKSHRNAGGDGKVYLVGHSMGGLAASYAANPRFGGSANVADHIGGLVTLDTPWAGSPWGGQAYAKLAQLVGNMRIPGPTSDAWNCLRKVTEQGAGGCTTPDYLPRAVPVAQIAGDLTVRREFFGFHAYDISLGSDTIVADGSQLGYLGSAPGSRLGLHTSLRTVKCTSTLDSLLAQGGQKLGSRLGPVGSIIGGLSGTELQLLADGKAMEAIGSETASLSLVEFLAVGFVASPCGHTQMPTNPDAISDVVEALKAQAAGPELIRTDLLNAPVPANCQHSASRLVNGNQPLKSSQGFATVLATGGGKDFRIQPLLSDVTGDGEPDLAGVLSCSAGGVTWPDTLLLYSTGPHLMGSLDMGDVTPISREHSDITSLTLENGDLRVKWSSYEGCCSLKQTWTALVHWDGTKLVPHGVKETGGAVEPTACKTATRQTVNGAICLFVRAARSGNTGSLSSDERSLAKEKAPWPTGAYTIGECGLQGDITSDCPVQFSSGTTVRLQVQPVNGDYDVDTGQYKAPPGQKLKYAVAG